LFSLLLLFTLLLMVLFNSVFSKLCWSILFLFGSPKLIQCLKPNGPFQIPLIGSVNFAWRIFKKLPLSETLKVYRKRFGDLFELKTGPVKQYWITDPNGSITWNVLNEKNCSGRSELMETAFGDEFLFLTRNADKAKVSK